MHDCVIIGGGPAGLTAAIYMARFLRPAILLSSGRPRLDHIPRSRNLPGFPDGIAGGEFLERLLEQASLYGIAPRDERVERITREGAAFTIVTATGTLQSRTVILATGVTNHRPAMSDAAHEDALSRGLIRYCPICDAFEVRGQRIAVYGGDDHALAEARFLRRYARDVWLTVPREPDDAPPDTALRARAEAAGVGLLEVVPGIADSSGETIALQLRGGGRKSFDTLYSALGTTAHSGLARGLGAALTAAGCIKVDAQNRTSVEGLYAIGDVIDGVDQIAFALGHAAVATTAIHNALS
ncbi:NAD(P)/FAD-dependent oxidoreductase [Profundibacterium mesophilum]|uniref:Thioredoxin reductase n=1 Tax=Profundibacterium mesophilum KAUST100406-0324 TaxID=1037889 RepID=A0A921TDW5_9RHOB|nr:NAD(P)/FAD-dependent oxidoreductase [Profundibacterium mesophilum]KAF0677248.1 Thioredoxin reductase [Profundibacterium mesophilum KAUST100406-0324]